MVFKWVYFEILTAYPVSSTEAECVKASARVSLMLLSLEALSYKEIKKTHKTSDRHIVRLEQKCRKRWRQIDHPLYTFHRTSKYGWKENIYHHHYQLYFSPFIISAVTGTACLQLKRKKLKKKEYELMQKRESYNERRKKKKKWMNSRKRLSLSSSPVKKKKNISDYL